MVEVRFGVPAEVAFDYLAEPRNRPRWQSSLRAVAEVDPGPPHEGQRWTDVTWPGLRPRMRLTVVDRPHAWTEVGSWRKLAHAELTLRFTPAGGGCVVTADFTLTLRGAARPLGRLLRPLATRAVAADLRRAARLLAARS